MKRTSITRLWAVFATAVSMVGTGCQSTGSSTQATLPSTPAPAEQEVAALPKAPADAAPELKSVYFEFDRWVLRDEARRSLLGNAEQLKSSAEREVLTLAGHCDERGSEEYNLALGDRRAAAVKRYLVDLGLPAAKLRTVSYGEGRPAVPGEGEAAWSRNRRVDFSRGTQQASR